MPTLLERHTAEFDTVTAEAEQILQRALDETREVTDDEAGRVAELNARRDTLAAAIDRETDLTVRRARVQERLSGISVGPEQREVRTGGAPPQSPTEREAAAVAEILREAPTPGAYAALAHQAWVRRDAAAVQRIDRVLELLRATAHQTTADNPGLIPQPIVGPVVDRMRTMRPLIASIGVDPAAAPKFDRPIVTQQVAVDVQANEKDPTASQKMLVGKVPVELDTYAGHVNISRQDIRWSQPNILNLIYGSFAKVYARRTDKAACVDFVAAVTQTHEYDELTASSIDAALGAIGQTIETADGDMGELNHLWMARDIATQLGSLRSPLGNRLYNIPVAGGTSGDLDGIPVTIDPRFAAGTFIGGDESLVEYFEEIDGFLSVAEPDVLGQLVGYAGFSDLVVLDATGFVSLVPTPVGP